MDDDLQAQADEMLRLQQELNPKLKGDKEAADLEMLRPQPGCAPACPNERKASPTAGKASPTERYSANAGEVEGYVSKNRQPRIAAEQGEVEREADLYYQTDLCGEIAYDPDQPDLWLLQQVCPYTLHPPKHTVY